jgi:hypothetical protein
VPTFKTKTQNSLKGEKETIIKLIVIGRRKGDRTEEREEGRGTNREREEGKKEKREIIR